MPRHGGNAIDAANTVQPTPDVVVPQSSGRKERRDPVAFDAKSGGSRGVPRKVAMRLIKTGLRAWPTLDGVFAVRT